MLASDSAVMIRLVVVFVMSITETQPTTTAHAMSPVMQEMTAVRMLLDFVFVSDMTFYIMHNNYTTLCMQRCSFYYE